MKQSIEGDHYFTATGGSRGRRGRIRSFVGNGSEKIIRPFLSIRDSPAGGTTGRPGLCFSRLGFIIS